ncbi:MAG: hypothetical protein SFU91_06870 [Chloroherpetonaceae bacterium]|nr:hypothetical protein [Chloroherpetonaceae bacterium]
MEGGLSWLIIYAFALPIFFGLVYGLYKFTSFKLDHDNEKFAPIFDTSDNVVGLDQSQLEAKKKEQFAAQKHLAEVIAKVPVELVNGKFVPIVKSEKPQAQLSEGTEK